MTARVCPHLRAVDNTNVYVYTPDAANRCYAVLADGPAHIPLDFQGRTCLGGPFEMCSRYRPVERPQNHRAASRWFVAGGGLVAVLVAGCALLAILGLILGLGASRLGLLARATETPQPTATPSMTWTPTTSLTPTEAITNTVTATTQPITPTATITPTNTPGDEFISPLATPMSPPTVAQPQFTATRRPLPSATRRPAPTATRGPTLTPSATNTRTPTATPTMNCRTDDTMTFNPATPATGKAFVIEVRSLLGYTDVSLSGGGKPRFNGTDTSGSYYIWRWEDSSKTAGTYTYSFKIKGGTATCITKSVAVTAPTDTPSPTPTVTPMFDFGLALIGSDFRPIYTETVSFEVDLTNGGNVTDSFEVWLETSPPQGWVAQYCIEDSCSDYTVPGTQVTLAKGAARALYIKLKAASDAPGGYVQPATLWVQSLGNPAKKKSQLVKVVVTQQSSP